MIAGAAVVGVWLVVVFAGIIARADELDATVQVEQAEVDALQMHADLADREITFVSTDAFVQQAARGEGYGEAGERRFRLPDDAPPPPTIRPLGSP
jgi:cell division protein FtsB